MSQRSDQRTSDSFADDLAATSEDDDSADSRFSLSLSKRLQRRITRVFSPRLLLYALLLLGGGMVAGNAFVPLPFLDSLAGLVGVFVGAFVLGLAVERSAVLESAVAGAAAAGLTAVLGHFALTAFGGAATQLAMFGAGTGLLAGALGAHLGGDLRNGLTQDI